MNRYARLAQQHWHQTNPERVAALEEQTAFFSSLGEQVETRVQELQDQMAGPDHPGEEYLAKVGRLNMARLQAEEMALAELVWLPGTAGDKTGDVAEDPDSPSEMDTFLTAIHQAANHPDEEPAEESRP